jgi:hypothetical protein
MGTCANQQGAVTASAVTARVLPQECGLAQLHIEWCGRDDAPSRCHRRKPAGGPEHRIAGAGHQRQIARSLASPMPDPSGRPGAQVPASAQPGREEPPDAPRFRHARRPDPLGVEPSFSLGSTHLTALSDLLHRARSPPSAANHAHFLSTNPQEVFITAIGLIVYRNLPVPISPQGVRRAPHSRQQVILCTWPLSFGNLASASWQ